MPGYNIPGVGSSRTKQVQLVDPLIIWPVQTVDTSSASATHTLPPVASNAGKHVIFKKTSASNTLTIDGYGSETIDGQSSIILYDNYEVVHLYCDGTAWYIL